MPYILKIIPAALPLLLLTSNCAFLSCTHPVRRLIFQPHKIQQIPPRPENLAHLERLWLKTEQGNVEYWIIKGDGIDADNPGPAVMIAHGNRELIWIVLNRIDAWGSQFF